MSVKVSKKYWYLFLFAIIIKALFFIYFQYLKNPYGFEQLIFYTVTGDANDYIEPVENLVEYGEHRTNDNNYSKRMPGYTPVLLFFRSYFSLDWAINLTLFFQVILSGISCFVLGLISFEFTKSIKVFFSVFLTYLISTYVSIWDTYILTESFATSSLIFSVFFLIRGYNETNKYYYLLSGVFITWSIFLRPFIVPVFVLILIIILFAKSPIQSFKKKVLHCLIFISPFVIAESSWVIRNYLNSKKLILTQSRVIYNDSGEVLNNDLSLQWYVGAFSASFGGDHTFWNPTGSSYWFFNKDAPLKENLFPEEIFNDSITIEDFKLVKKKCIALKSDSLDIKTKISNETYIRKTLRESINHYIKSHPFHYYITSRIIHLKNFIIHSGVYNIPFEEYKRQNIFQKLFKFFYSLLYLSIFILGGLGSLFLLKSYINKVIFVVIFITPIYIIFLFPFIFKIHEYRFNTLAYPFLVISFVIIIFRVIEFTKKYFLKYVKMEI